MKKTLLFLLVSFQIAVGQISINEYSAANLEGYLDNYERTEDWIELHNSSDEDFDLSGYHLSDKESKPGKWEIPAGTIIPGKGYLVFWCSGRDEACDDNYHTNFKLSQTKGGETLLLTDDSESVLDMIEVEYTLVESSRCREFDGNGEWKICPEPTLRANNQEGQKYNSYTTAPSMDMEAGYYESEIVVSIINNTPESTLRYTTDGTNPTEDSPEYFSPITVTETTVIKAMSFSNDSSMLTGKMDFNTYFVGEDFTLPVFSVAADRVKDLANGNGELIPIGSIEYFNLDKVREATSFGSLNRHGQDSWVLDHRSLDWVSRDEMGYSKAVEAQLFPDSDRDEYQKFMFRNSGDDNYPAINDNDHQGSTHVRDEYVQALAKEGGLKLDYRSVRRVIVFLNGEYWGVYGMRDRPVDHDYTDFYYDQGKYDTQFLTTWGDTEIQYGGQQALNDWYRLRNFILENDMGDTTNYEKVMDEFNALSLIDYMIVNLNSVASDWMNYNTGWWRGLNEDGDHKKWGYILWDLDATFDYYINYSGVPDISPNAKPCDIEDISDFMDNFFGNNTGEPGPMGVSCDVNLNTETCQSIVNGTSPYPATDSIFQLVINQDQACCENWDGTCDSQYEVLNSDGPDVSNCPSLNNPNFPYEIDDPIVAQVIAVIPQCCNNWGGWCNNVYDFIDNGGEVGQDVDGNVGMHEKIFLKLQEESEVFRQLYYSRQADLMNTVYSCDNMLTTLDRMIGVIEPEMPRQIQRWGGTLSEWNSNVDRLRNFISQRCEKLDDGMVSCFDVTGPYNLTLMTEPDGVGEIDLNTLDIEEFPWSGDYFGNMQNKIKARAFDEDEWEFSHWESKSGSEILPNDLSRKATIQIETTDTLVAVFKNLLSTNDVANDIDLTLYPNPTSGVVTIKYQLDDGVDVQVSLTNMMGQEIMTFADASGRKSAGSHTSVLDLESNAVPPGMYLIRIASEQFETIKKVSVLR